MPMINCRNCGKLISTRAGYCCRCGMKIANSDVDGRYERGKRLKQKLDTVSFIFLELVVALGLSFALFYILRNK